MTPPAAVETSTRTSPVEPGARVPARTPVAYLNSEYPSLSHTFIEREVRSVRAAGGEIQTFSVRRAASAARIGRDNERAAEETFVILDGAASVASSAIAAAIASPAGFFRALVASQKLSPSGLPSRLKHLAYVVEALRLARELHRRGLRHIHVHMANNGAAIALLATRYAPSLSYSLTIHGSAEFFQVDSWRLAQKVRAARFVRCISNYCRAQIMVWTEPAVWERLHVVHCGIDPGVYSPPGGEAARPRRPGPLRLLTVGRLHPIKGYPVLLDACRLLSDQGIQWELDMVGDGPMRPALQKQAHDLGIADRIRISGAVAQENIQPHFDAADAMVISSFMEGVPIVLMEAMAKGLGVVATRVGGIPELVEHGVHGLLVDPASPESLAEGLAALAADPERCVRFGRAGRQRIIDEFSITAVGPAMNALLGAFGR